MPDLKVKVGLIGKLDMLKFKNMKKVRESAIQAAPADEISGVFPVNENAKALHPDVMKLVIDEIIDRGAAEAKTYILTAGGQLCLALVFPLPVAESGAGGQVCHHDPLEPRRLRRRQAA